MNPGPAGKLRWPTEKVTEPAEFYGVARENFSESRKASPRRRNLLFERKSTLHTGDVVTEKTRSLEGQLRLWLWSRGPSRIPGDRAPPGMAPEGLAVIAGASPLAGRAGILPTVRTGERIDRAGASAAHGLRQLQG